MPQIIGEYTYTVVDGDMTIPNLTAKPRKIYPVPSDSTIYVLEEDYMQFIDFYEPLAPSQRHDTIPNLFFTGDSPISDIGNGVGRWTRTWSVLPGYDASGKKTGYTSLEYESFVFSVPGISVGPAIYLYNQVASSTNGNTNLSMTTTAPHDITVGDAVTVGYYVSDPINNYQYWRTMPRIALAGTAGSAVVVAKIVDIGAIDVRTVMLQTGNAEPYQKTVASKIVKDYWLPGVNIPTVDDIPLIQEFFILDTQTGARSEYLSDTSAPAITEYRALIELGSWLVAEPSVLRRWNGSEILERSTRYVKYTL